MLFEHALKSRHVSQPARNQQLTSGKQKNKKVKKDKIRSIGWRRGVVVSGVRRINEVNARRAPLVPGWVTVFGWVYHLGM